MNHCVGIDVSLEVSSVCIVDSNGNIVCEGKVASEPEALIAWRDEEGQSGASAQLAVIMHRMLADGAKFRHVAAAV